MKIILAICLVLPFCKAKQDNQKAKEKPDYQIVREKRYKERELKIEQKGNISKNKEKFQFGDLSINRSDIIDEREEVFNALVEELPKLSEKISISVRERNLAKFFKLLTPEFQNYILQNQCKFKGRCDLSKEKILESILEDTSDLKKQADISGLNTFFNLDDWGSAKIYKKNEEIHSVYFIQEDHDKKLLLLKMMIYEKQSYYGEKERVSPYYSEEFKVVFKDYKNPLIYDIYNYYGGEARPDSIECENCPKCEKCIKKQQDQQ